MLHSRTQLLQVTQVKLIFWFFIVRTKPEKKIGRMVTELKTLPAHKSLGPDMTVSL